MSIAVGGCQRFAGSLPGGLGTCEAYWPRKEDETEKGVSDSADPALHVMSCSLAQAAQEAATQQLASSLLSGLAAGMQRASRERSGLVAGSTAFGKVCLTS